MEKLEYSRTCKVLTLNMYELIVKDGDLNGHVKILEKTCSCWEFQLDQLPCEHTFTVCRFHEIFFIYNMCSYYYFNETWIAAYT